MSRKSDEKENNNTFLSQLLGTGKYKDLFTTSEGIISIICAVILAYFFTTFLIKKPIEEVNSILFDISISFIACLISLLGITFTGLAFVSGTVSLKATENLFKKDKIDSLKSIYFTFYFLGWIIAIDILLYMVVLLLSMSEALIGFRWMFVVSFIIFYFTIFIILYTVGLFDTCIKIFFVNYKYNSKDDIDKK